jgi:hypothetical protein
MVNGASEDYSEFREVVSNLDMDWFLAFGNWEKTEENWEQLSRAHTGMDQTYFSVNRNGFHFVILDSAVHGEIGGHLDDAQIRWLEKDLESNFDKPTMIFMHHPLEEEGVFTIDDDSRSRLTDVLEKNGQVLSVVGGHNHRNERHSIGTREHLSIASLIQYPIGYSKVDLCANGITQHFVKIEDLLRLSEESRVKLEASKASLQADSEYLGKVDDRSFSIEITENHPPFIEEVIIQNDNLEPGERFQLEIMAFDPDRDPLTYHLEIDEETVPGSGPLRTINAPDTVGEHNIGITVSDGKSNVVSNISVKVISPDGMVDHPPMILGIKTSREAVEPGGTVSVNIDASDVDGDDLVYLWSSTGGTVLGSGSSIDWIAPNSEGLYTIEVEVISTIHSTFGSIDVNVVISDSPSDDEYDGANNASETTLPFMNIISGSLITTFIVWAYRRRWS